MKSMKLFGALALGALLTTPAYAADTQQGAAPMQAQPKLSDAQIAAVVVAANDIEIASGKMASDKTKNTAVKAFAERMIADHGSINSQAKDLVKKLDVKPEESDLSKGLTKTADQTRDRLKKLKGAQFDSEYIKNEIAFHEQVIDTVDKALLPNAQNAELKALIQQVRPTLASHLDHAKQVQGQLKPS